ncbi:hypothetical protein O6H91_01G115700 [Diphasiastrum complanatum]|uniref:Uncharacterized protein n=1 Tax=Diphasiastrum complanatum TaxID=34168 RepID=A0ACC2EV24_DIPCM|nr:hypothetical protein O6H91_01G115700 [Diphasiastrum complanatum]
MWGDLIEIDGLKGIYKVCGKLWMVGPRYKLHEQIGSGSYGDVCRAIDCETAQTVALKRVADVFFCPLLAKRVLREVCIMRRLSHPYVISLTNVFTNLSLEISGGVDLYIATEFADGGDMYHLSDSLTSGEVKLLLWQLLVAVKYIHSCHVWHRDIKSENVLLTKDKCVKICDFGLSRSADELPTKASTKRGTGDGRRMLVGKKLLTRQYTKMVVTPSYRAPEVIMSQGQYSSAIDIWSLGCIFWELMIRNMNPSTPGPPSRPLFGVRGEPVTPERGENYAADGDSPLAEQLDVIFDVIGTPCWSDIVSVPSETWRSYLKGLPGRAGNLSRQLSGYVDEQAFDLLSRMLAFNPSRRCTADEALEHIYFKDLQTPKDSVQLSFEDTSASLPGDSFWKIRHPANALEFLERELEASAYEPDGGRCKLEWLLQREVEQQQQQNMLRQSFMKTFAAAKFFSHIESPTKNLTGPSCTGALPGYISLTNMGAVGQTGFGGKHQRSQEISHEEGSQGKILDLLSSGKTCEAEQSFLDVDAHVKENLPWKTVVRQGSLRFEIVNPAKPGFSSYQSLYQQICSSTSTSTNIFATCTTPDSVSQRLVSDDIQSPAECPSRTTCELITSIDSQQKELLDVNKAQCQGSEVVLRRSPRLRDLLDGGLPQRKRFCLNAR